MRKATLVLVLPLLAACGETPPPPVPPKLVRVVTVGAGDTANPAARRSYSGEVRARLETTPGFRIAGKLVERRVDAGQVVKAGQVLARLDPADAALQAAAAEAQQSLATADLARARDLRAKNFISAAALDARESAARTASAQAQLARNQAGYAALVADRDGVVAQVLAEPGQVVGAGQAVFRLAVDGEREVAIAVPESEVAGLRPGAPAEVSLWAEGAAAKPLPGRLREISPAADPVTRTYAARVSLKEVDPRLPLGLSATVRFVPAAAAPGATGETRLAVPLTAIFQQGEEPAVWKVGADGTVTLQRIKVAAFVDGGALVAEGLAGGETIVAAGVNLLSAGEKVRLAKRTVAR